MTDKMRRRAPGMVREHLQASDRVHASDRFARGKLSGRDRAERRFAVSLSQFSQCFRGLCEPDRDAGRLERGIGFGRHWRLAP